MKYACDVPKKTKKRVLLKCKPEVTDPTHTVSKKRSKIQLVILI